MRGQAPRGVGHATTGGIMGMAILVSGVLLGGFLALHLVDLPRAFNLWMWLHPWLPASIEDPVVFANKAINTSKFLPSVIAIVMCAIGSFLLVQSRAALRPANQSDNGKFEIELPAAEQHVGAPLVGTIRVLGEAKPGEFFTLTLECQMKYETGKGTEMHYAFRESQDVRLVPGAHAPALPFRFDVPGTAPATNASGQGYMLGGGVYYWTLTVGRKDAWVGAGVFDVTLLAAA